MIDHLVSVIMKLGHYSSFMAKRPMVPITDPQDRWLLGIHRQWRSKIIRGPGSKVGGGPYC